MPDAAGNVKGIALSGKAGEVLDRIKQQRDERLNIEFNFADDWSGEVREDPEDGNAYVLRGFMQQTPLRIVINDVFGGHTRIILVDEWLQWLKQTID